MPRRNETLRKRDEAFQAAASEQREATKEALEPRKLTLNLSELEIPEGGELPPRIAQAVALRLVGLNPGQIAERLGLERSTVNQYLYIARMKGKLTDVGPILDHAVVPMAVENLIAGLEAGDKEYTLEVLKGRGAFRSHSANVSTGSAGPMHLQIQVELPKGASGTVIDVIPGQVMGAPRE
jgi:hypothetical protein